MGFSTFRKTQNRVGVSPFLEPPIYIPMASNVPWCIPIRSSCSTYSGWFLGCSLIYNVSWCILIQFLGLVPINHHRVKWCRSVTVFKDSAFTAAGPDRSWAELPTECVDDDSVSYHVMGYGICNQIILCYSILCGVIVV